jgi:hypothetical protein
MAVMCYSVNSGKYVVFVFSRFFFCVIFFLESHSRAHFQAKWFDMIDELWVVTVPPAVACERIQRRNHLTEDQAMVRINAQLTNAEREAYADQVISYVTFVHVFVDFHSIVLSI